MKKREWWGTMEECKGEKNGIDSMEWKWKLKVFHQKYGEKTGIEFTFLPEQLYHPYGIHD